MSHMAVAPPFNSVEIIADQLSGSSSQPRTIRCASVRARHATPRTLRKIVLSVVVDSGPFDDDNNSTIRCDLRKPSVQIREKPYRSPLIELVHPLHRLRDARSSCAPEEERR